MFVREGTPAARNHQIRSSNSERTNDNKGMTPESETNNTTMITICVKLDTLFGELLELLLRLSDRGLCYLFIDGSVGNRMILIESKCTPGDLAPCQRFNIGPPKVADNRFRG